MKLIERLRADSIIDSWNKYREAILSLLERDEDAKLLDLGCGEGYFTRRIAKRIGTEKVYGVDLDGKNRVGETVYLSDLNDAFPVENGAFDVVIASHVIEHLWNTDGFAKEIRKALKPTGYAIISTPNLAAWHNVLYLILGRQPAPAAVSDEMYPWVESPGHRRVFTTTELIRFLEFHDFVVEKAVGTSYFPLTGKLANWPTRKDWKHTGNITVKVRRR